MNRPDINRSILRMHIAAIEAKHPIKILGLLPRGSVGPAGQIQLVLERYDQRRGDRPQFLAAHGLHLLDDVLPVDLVVDRLTLRQTPQQRGLAFGPAHDISVVVAHLGSRWLIE